MRHRHAVFSIFSVSTGMTFPETKQYAHESYNSYVYVHVVDMLCINVSVCTDIENAYIVRHFVDAVKWTHVLVKCI